MDSYKQMMMFLDVAILGNKDKALDRTDMKHINIRSTKPYYESTRYYVSWHDEGDYATWYRADRPFKKE